MIVYLQYIAKPSGIENVQITVDSKSAQTFNIDGVSITITPKEYTLLLTQAVELNEEELNQLRDINKIYEEGSINYKLAENLFDKLKTVLRYLKYFYGISELDENFNAVGKPQWSIDKKNWTDISMKRNGKWIPTSPIYGFPESLVLWMPILVSNNVQPLFAFSHLHKAFIEKDTRHQWINATISAELAFKEFLSLYDRKCASLITYAPSPPLPILYKQVLKEQTGEESPYSKELGEGARTRNDLIHKPNHKPPTKAETIIYLHIVQSAILHLHYLLNKEIPVMKYFYDRSIGALESVKASFGKK